MYGKFFIDFFGGFLGLFSDVSFGSDVEGVSGQASLGFGPVNITFGPVNNRFGPIQ